MLGITSSAAASDMTVLERAGRPRSILLSVSRAIPTRQANWSCVKPAFILHCSRPGSGRPGRTRGTGPAPQRPGTSSADTPQRSSIDQCAAPLETTCDAPLIDWWPAPGEVRIRVSHVTPKAAARRSITSGRTGRPRSILPSVSRAIPARAATSGWVMPRASRHARSPGTRRGAQRIALSSAAKPRTASACLTLATSSPARLPLGDETAQVQDSSRAAAQDPTGLPRGQTSLRPQKMHRRASHLGHLASATRPQDVVRADARQVRDQVEHFPHWYALRSHSFQPSVRVDVRIEGIRFACRVMC